MTRLILIPAVLAATLAGCSQPSPPDLQGTWTGTASYADTGGTAKGGPEKLVIENQEGTLLWGYTEYTDFDGTAKREPVTGTQTEDGGVFLTEQATLWQGEYDHGRLVFVVSWTKGEGNHGAFEMTMTKE